MKGKKAMRNFILMTTMLFVIPLTSWAKSLVEPGKCELIIGSRSSLADAQQLLSEQPNKDFSKIFFSENGWFAVSIGTLRPDEEDKVLTAWKASGRIPEDSYCSKGEPYLLQYDWRTGKKMEPQWWTKEETLTETAAPTFTTSQTVGLVATIFARENKDKKKQAFSGPGESGVFELTNLGVAEAYPFKLDVYNRDPDLSYYANRIAGVLWSGEVFLSKPGNYLFVNHLTQGPGRSVKLRCHQELSVANVGIPPVRSTFFEGTVRSSEGRLRIAEPGYYPIRIWQSCGYDTAFGRGDARTQHSTVRAEIQMVAPGEVRPVPVAGNILRY